VIQVQPDTSGARALLRDLQQREIPKVIGRTLNRTANSVRSRASRDLRTRMNLQKSVIDKAITRRRSNEIQNLTALALGRAWFEISYSGKPFPLRDFAAKQVRSGVSFKVTKAGRRAVYLRQGRKGFLVQRLGGNVFVRTTDDPAGPQKAKIQKVFGPSIPQFAATKRVQNELIEYARDFWARELERNIRFAIGRRT
jgi:hypothetical protein